MRAMVMVLVVFIAACAGGQGSREAFQMADAKYVKLLRQAQQEPTFENRRLACEGWYDWYLALEEFEDGEATVSLYSYYAQRSDEHSVSCAADQLADGTPVYVPRS